MIFFANFLRRSNILNSEDYIYSARNVISARILIEDSKIIKLVMIFLPSFASVRYVVDICKICEVKVQGSDCKSVDLDLLDWSASINIPLIFIVDGAKLFFNWLDNSIANRICVVYFESISEKLDIGSKCSCLNLVSLSFLRRI